MNKDVVGPPLFWKYVRSGRKTQENGSEIEVKCYLFNFMNLIIWEISCPFPFIFFVLFCSSRFFLMSLPLPHLKKTPDATSVLCLEAQQRVMKNHYAAAQSQNTPSHIHLYCLLTWTIRFIGLTYMHTLSEQTYVDIKKKSQF